MNPVTEEIIQALKKERAEKGISQRELSEKSGIPQSHISKIENGLIDITLSTLVELVRSLELEVLLIPKRSIPAVKAIIASSTSKNSGAVKITLNELKKLENAIKDVKDVEKTKNEIRKLSYLFNTVRGDFLKTKYLLNLKDINKNIRSFNEGQIPLSKLQETSKIIKQMRNELAHSIPDKPKPAYSLEDDNV